MILTWPCPVNEPIIGTILNYYIVLALSEIFVVIVAIGATAMYADGCSKTTSSARSRSKRWDN
jgi:hypothetical protein